MRQITITEAVIMVVYVIVIALFGRMIRNYHLEKRA